MTSVLGGVHKHHVNFSCSLPGGVGAHHGVFRARDFETPATFYVVAKSHWTVQWFIQASQKTSPLPLLINIDVTPSIWMNIKGIFSDSSNIFYDMNQKI